MVAVSKVCCLAQGGEKTVSVPFANMNVLEGGMDRERKGDKSRKEKRT